MKDWVTFNHINQLKGHLLLLRFSLLRFGLFLLCFVFFHWCRKGKPQAGLEPATICLQSRRTAIVLLWRDGRLIVLKLGANCPTISQPNWLGLLLRIFRNGKISSQAFNIVQVNTLGLAGIACPQIPQGLAFVDDRLKLPGYCATGQDYIGCISDGFDFHSYWVG